MGNQKYCIATSTFVGTIKADLSTFTDEFFKREKVEKKDKSEDAFFQETEKKEKPAEWTAAQKKIDGSVAPLIKKDIMLKKYLQARFSLTNTMKPHELRF